MATFKRAFGKTIGKVSGEAQNNIYGYREILFFVLQIEDAAKNEELSSDKMYEIYHDDYPAWSKTELYNCAQELRANSITWEEKQDFINRIKVLDFDRRFTSLAMTAYSRGPEKVYLQGNIDFALQQIKDFFSEDELTEVKKKLEAKLQETKDSIRKQLKFANDLFETFEKAKECLFVYIYNDEQEEYDPQNFMQKKTEDGKILSVVLARKGISTTLIAVMPTVWDCTLEDIWVAAKNNIVDKTGNNDKYVTFNVVDNKVKTVSSLDEKPDLQENNDTVDNTCEIVVETKKLSWQDEFGILNGLNKNILSNAECGDKDSLLVVLSAIYQGVKTGKNCAELVKYWGELAIRFRAPDACAFYGMIILDEAGNVSQCKEAFTIALNSANLKIRKMATQALQTLKEKQYHSSNLFNETSEESVVEHKRREDSLQKYSHDVQAKLNSIIEKLLLFYPERKIFAFDSLCGTIRDTLSSEAKKLGIGNYREILVDFGFEFIEKEETELLRNKVIYTPGNEPDFMMAKIKGMLSSLASYYPNKIIEKSIISEHQKLAGNITGLYQWFGYPNANEFLAAYGYDYKIAPPANVVTFDTNELIEELQRRTEGKRLISLNELRDLNPDLVEKIEIVRTRSVKLYGTTFVDYLQSKGILYSTAQLELLALDDFIADMNKKYPQGSSFATVNALFAEQSNAHYDRAVLSSAVRSKYNLSLQEYLVQEKILVDKKADDAVKFADFELNSTKARIMSYRGTSTIVEIPAEIKIIEKGAFKNTAVEEISFKSGSLLTSIEEGAFECCKNLKSIDFTNITKSVKIKSGAFKNCEEFREIYAWQKIVKVYEGAFEGAKNIFIYDGEYIYPRLWLYNLSNNGCSGSTVFGIDETYGDDCTPLVEILTPYGRIDEYYVQINEIPIASRCGYNGIVYSGLYDFDNEDACYSNCKREFYMEFDLPTVESVSVYLKNYEIEIDESEKLDILISEDKYVKKQRAIFENLKAYAAKRKAERKEKGLPEELLLENFPLITKPGEKQVYVKFIGGREYNYNCRFDVKKGDLVFVDGSMEGVLGYVDSVENGLASGDFMKDVIKVYAVKKSKSIFPYAIEEEEVLEVFPNLQVEERDEEDYGDYEDEEYEEDEDYDEYEDEGEDDGVSPQEDSVCEITNGKSSSGQDLFGRYELLDAKKLEHNLYEGSYEISLYIENCKTINGELKTSWVEGDERYDLFLVYYNDKEIGSIAVSARGNDEGSIKIEAAKVEIDGNGLKLNAVINVDVVDVPSTPRYREDGKKVLVYSSHSVEGANILAYKNVDLTDSELDSLAKVLGKWVKTKTRKKATDDELKIMFLAVYDDFHVGDLIDEESSKEQFEKELKQYRTGKLDKENCGKMIKCYLRAIDLTKRGYEVFVGPFTENDELVLDHKNYVGIVLAEGANYGSPIEFNYENSEEISNETDDEEIEDEVEEQISYFVHEGFSSLRDKALWNEYTDEVFFLKKEYHNPYCIALDSSTNIYSVAFISQKEARTKERFRISYKENRDTECSQYGMDYTKNFAYYAIYCDGDEVAEIPFDAENFTLVKNKDVKIIATYCSDGIISNYKEFEIHLLFQIDFKDANGKKIEFPEFGKTKQSRCKVKVKFPDGRSYFYNCEYAVQVGDKVQVGGKRSDQEGEVVAIENAWDSSPYMQCVEKVLSASGELNPTQTQANEINTVQGVLEKPLIIDDDYPFGYERDDKMIKLINNARQGNQEAIKELVEIYSASNDTFVKEQKAKYWQSKLV